MSNCHVILFLTALLFFHIKHRQQAVRVFTSAPIAKRYDAYTLETEDGITVIIQGMINKALTQDNGFPPEVCDFLFPFLFWYISH